MPRPMTKAEAERAQRALKEDYVPKGKPVRIKDLTFRKLKDDEPVYQCCKPTAHDIQSGPIFCGKIASYIAFVSAENGYVFLCENHPPPKENIV